MEKKTFKYSVKLSENDAISISMGNTKIGKIMNFNTLPAVDYVIAKGVAVVDVKGTCGSVDCSQCSKKCYAVHSLQQHYNTCAVSWAKNTLLIRHDLKKVEKQMNGAIRYKSPDLFRFHSAGEIESVEQFATYCKVARKNKGTKFCIYTKAFGLLSDYITGGGSLPRNLVVNLSEWHGNINEYLTTASTKVRRAFNKMNIFSYYDGDDACMQSDKFVFCPAVNSKGRETGVKCEQCQRCYKAGHLTRVYPH